MLLAACASTRPSERQREEAPVGGRRRRTGHREQAADHARGQRHREHARAHDQQPARHEVHRLAGCQVLRAQHLGPVAPGGAGRDARGAGGGFDARRGGGFCGRHRHLLGAGQPSPMGVRSPAARCASAASRAGLLANGSARVRCDAGPRLRDAQWRGAGLRRGRSRGAARRPVRGSAGRSAALRAAGARGALGRLAGSLAHGAGRAPAQLAGHAHARSRRRRAGRGLPHAPDLDARPRFAGAVPSSCGCTAAHSRAVRARCRSSTAHASRVVATWWSSTSTTGWARSASSRIRTASRAARSRPTTGCSTRSPRSPGCASTRNGSAATRRA